MPRGGELQSQFSPSRPFNFTYIIKFHYGKIIFAKPTIIFPSFSLCLPTAKEASGGPQERELLFRV